MRGVDLKYPRFSETEADDFIRGDLTDFQTCGDAVDRRFDEIYQIAADMGGAGFIFTGENDADVMHNSKKTCDASTFKVLSAFGVESLITTLSSKSSVGARASRSSAALKRRTLGSPSR